RKEVLQLKSVNITNIVCPVCNGSGQVTTEQVEDDKQYKINKDDLEEAKESFNLDKSNKLIRLQTEGLTIKNEISEMSEKIEELTKKIESSEEVLKDLKKEETKHIQEISEIKVKIYEIEEKIEKFYIEEKIKLKKIIETKKEKIENINFSEEKESIKIELNKIEIEKKDVSEKIFIIKNNEEVMKRNSQLQRELAELSKSFLEAEKQIFITEKFIKAKVALLEKEVAKNFKNVGFKLFATQVNGGLSETCETTVNGVPYSDVNTAGKVNAGIDIVNTLNKFYKVTVPLFIDNRESVVEIIETDSQVINLIVDGCTEKIKVKGE
ncbi:MAG: hypothetical protein ACRC68_01780, partial [Clostridium sp.]